MQYLTITSIIITLHISTLQAICNKTQGQAQIQTQYDELDRKNQTLLKNQTTPNEHDLRVEYNKYQILNRLGLTGDPSDWNLPKINNDLIKKAEEDFEKNSNNNTKENSVPTNFVNLRHKRSLACSQVKSDKDACCLETFYVNFTDIGWDKWILYPPGYNANYCRGQCDLSHARYYHSTLLSKFSHVIGLCCSPRQMSALRLLFVDESNKVHQKSIPDMVVESCDCA